MSIGAALILLFLGDICMAEESATVNLADPNVVGWAQVKESDEKKSRDLASDPAKQTVINFLTERNSTWHPPALDIEVGLLDETNPSESESADFASKSADSVDLKARVRTILRGGTPARDASSEAID